MTPLERAARELVYWKMLGELNHVDAMAFADESWEMMVPTVRRVLEAIREPTETMIERGISDGLHNQPSGDNPDTHRMAAETWQAMIDAALAEKPE